MRKMIIVLAALSLLATMALPAAADGDLEFTFPGASKGPEYPLPAGKTIRMVFKAGMSPEGECSYYVRPSQEAMGGSMRRTATVNLSLSGCESCYKFTTTDKINIKCKYKIADTTKESSFTYLNDSKGIVHLSAVLIFFRVARLPGLGLLPGPGFCFQQAASGKTLGVYRDQTIKRR